MSLLEKIQKNKDVRKIFGKQELKIIEKQLLGINLTASEKIRLSRDIRKKFNIINELSQFSDEFSLKKASEIKYLINEAKQIILESKQYSNIKKIFLFGSFIQRELNLNSDIDIAVEFKKISKKDATKFRAEISGRVNDKIDIQVFNILPEKIKKQILNKGRIIYSNE